MKFGIAFANAAGFANPDNAIAIAQGAEANGFDSLWTVEHVIVAAGYQSAYPYSPDGKMPGGDSAVIPDPLVWLAFVAAHTTTLKLGTGILILPQRSPVVVAKEVATLDRLSRGRVLLGVGIGWLEEEFQAIGVPFKERGARLDEHVAVMREAWKGNNISFAGRFTNFPVSFSQPTPADGRSVPIVVGGHSPQAARRAGRIGDGFFPAGGTADQLTALLAIMRDAAIEAGRDADAIEITTSAASSIDEMKRFEDIGVHRVLIGPRHYDARVTDQLERYQQDVISKM